MSTILYFKESIKLFEALAAVTGFVTWHKWKNSYLKWLPVYLTVITFCDTTGYILAKLKKVAAIGPWYSYFVIPLEILFFCWLFYRYLPRRQRLTAPAGAGAFIISLVVETFSIGHEGHYIKSLSLSVGIIVILVLTISFFVNLLNSDQILYFKTNCMFWISLGLLVFYLGTFPYYCLYNVLAKDIYSFIKYTWVMIFLNYSMYLLFAIGFIWGKPTSTFSSSSLTSSS